ncbi:Ribosome 60S biogenesis N-terminal [Musa troglodytarum]|uniref:Ribosome 60S biogenesis N-terminal n=1 Tax=Musa troglodytarum TaxID=320322 RepID=A0A9E7ECL1_9LILI|nr:Ribosome 60S biogenesis N-terminal [Musa troglodytarum]
MIFDVSSTCAYSLVMHVAWLGYNIFASFDQPWRDAASEPTGINQMEEEQACRSLLVMFSTALFGKQSGFPVLTYLDLEKSGLFEWERCIYHNKKWNREAVL